MKRFGPLNTARLALRPVGETDPREMARALDDFAVSRWLVPVPHPYTEADAMAFQADCARKGWPVWSIFDSEGLAGGVDIVASLGYWIAPRAQGRGYATEAGRAVLHAWFADPAAGDVTSSYFLGNDASGAVLGKLGFVPDGPVRLPSLARAQKVDAMRMRLTRVAFTRQPVFTARTARLRLDALTQADGPVVHAQWGDPRVARMVASVKPNWTEDEARAWIDARSGFGVAVRLHDGTLIGSVGMGRDPARIGYMFGCRYWGNGYATEAIGAFLAGAFAHLGDLGAIEAEVFNDNPASARVLQKLGFAAIGPGFCTSLARVEPAANTLYRLTRSSLKV